MTVFHSAWFEHREHLKNIVEVDYSNTTTRLKTVSIPAGTRSSEAKEEITPYYYHVQTVNKMHNYIGNIL
jgi:hypothetical protein